MSVLSSDALDQLFRQARTHSHWQETPADPALLRQLYELMKYGPTSANASPSLRRLAWVSRSMQ